MGRSCEELSTLQRTVLGEILTPDSLVRRPAVIWSPGRSIKPVRRIFHSQNSQYVGKQKYTTHFHFQTSNAWYLLLVLVLACKQRNIKFYKGRCTASTDSIV